MKLARVELEEFDDLELLELLVKLARVELDEFDESEVPELVVRLANVELDELLVKLRAVELLVSL